jgi:hypothetical protein
MIDDVLFDLYRDGLPEHLKGRAMTAIELVDEPIDDMQYAVKGLFVQGLTLVPARPKVGKSTLSLDLSFCVAEGVPFLDTYETSQGVVLHVAIDDRSKARTKERFVKRVNGKKPPYSLIYDYQWAKLPRKPKEPREEETGLSDFFAYADTFGNDLRLIQIDLLTDIIPAFRTDVDAYQIWYEILPPLKDFAHERKISIVGYVHATKDHNEKNIVDAVMGSTAVAAIADNIVGIVEDRKTGQRHLELKGKDLDESEDVYLHYDKGIERLYRTEKQSAYNTVPTETLPKGMSKIDQFIMFVKNEPGIAHKQMKQRLGTDSDASVYNLANDAAWNKKATCNDDGKYWPKEHERCKELERQRQPQTAEPLQ